MSGIKKSKDEKKTRVTIGFSSPLLKRIDAQAKIEGRGRGQLVRRAMSRYLDAEDLKRSN
jgi:metal-responsive CopG/Arc/MetJ family transcriptional regulator